MVNFYVIQIRDLKTMTIDDVPKLWRAKGSFLLQTKGVMRYADG